ncbi:TLD-domain-containing protein [Gigaspora rosea]|uniref:TLD-domain-containing protein n=1 Tax=Gigaspora rosea TaxID=44941 RepID=A0A397VLL5_9GLOM|nr:TLD-domain-containing protein [Gigaspora rosea]
MHVAFEFYLEELARHIENYLIETKANWLRLHFMRIYQKSFQNNQFQNLQKWCNDFLVKYPNKIFDSEDFTSLQENALVSLIKRDDLQMEEIKIWNYIIKWGIAQNPGLPLNGPEQWTNENFLVLKNTLQNCLPYIRYFQISGDDIVENVQPYHQILDKNLWNDIMNRTVNPNRQVLSVILPTRTILKPTLPPRISRSAETFSTIINEAHAAEISSWIDKKTETYSVTNNPYNFNLLLRGTRDGFTANAFWNLCDKQANTIVIMKVKNTDEILGGYNPINWDKSINGYISCDDSFIFSLKNGNILFSILSRIECSRNAIYCSSNYGPCFGCNDLDMVDFFNQDVNQCICLHNSYEKAIKNLAGSRFSISEYEIFQIKKK